jgi:iron complex outermembrane receptor protein
VTQIGLPAGIGASAIVGSVNTLGSASPYFSAISVGGFPGQPGSSQALLTAPQGLYNYVVSPTYNKDIYILDHFVNSGTVKIDAYDIDAEYAWRTTNSGKFTVGTAATYLQHFEVQDLPGALLYEDAGYSTNGKTMGWSAVIGNTFFGATTDINNGAIPSVWLATHAPTRVASYTAWDAQIGYTFSDPQAPHWRALRGWEVQVGVNNAFNRMPPFAPLSNAASGNNNNVDVATYSPIGRLWYVAATVKF